VKSSFRIGTEAVSDELYDSPAMREEREKHYMASVLRDGVVLDGLPGLASEIERLINDLDAIYFDPERHAAESERLRKHPHRETFCSVLEDVACLPRLLDQKGFPMGVSDEARLEAGQLVVASDARRTGSKERLAAAARGFVVTTMRGRRPESRRGRSALIPTLDLLLSDYGMWFKRELEEWIEDDHDFFKREPLRRRGRRDPRLDLETTEGLDFERAEDRALLARLAQHGKLTGSEREVLQARYQDLSFEEMAGLQKRRPVTCRVIWLRLVRKLRAHRSEFFADVNVFP